VATITPCARLVSTGGSSIDRKPLGAGRIGEYPVRVPRYPAIGAVDLYHRRLDGLPVEPRPRDLDGLVVLVLDMLIAEDDHVIAANHQLVAQLLPVSLATLLLVVEQVRVGPQVQKGLLAQVRKQTFGSGRGLCYGESPPTAKMIAAQKLSTETTIVSASRLHWKQIVDPRQKVKETA
jgi:hypothetical protein